MRKMRLAAGAAGAALLIGGLLPVAAQAAPAAPASAASEVGTQANLCDNKLAYSGYVHVYWNSGCNSTPKCSTESWDSDYGNNSGPCQASDTNSANSVLNNGYSGGLDDVRFYDGTGTDWGGSSLCLGNHKYITDLGTWNNKISSHQWVSSC